MSLLYAIHQQYKLLTVICTRSEVRLGGSTCTATRAVIEGFATLYSTQGGFEVV